MLGSLEAMRLEDEDLASVPDEHLASLASCVTKRVRINNISNTDLCPILDNVKSQSLGFFLQSLHSEETKALVRAMEANVEIVDLAFGVSLDFEALTQYSGQGKCDIVKYYGDKHIPNRIMNFQYLRRWAQRNNWEAIESLRWKNLDDSIRLILSRKKKEVSQT